MKKPEMLYEAADAARRVGLTPETIKRHADDGTLPLAARTPRGTRLFRPADVDRFAREREQA
jgi:DNA-binding transcriptional MerR regulator